MRLSKILVFIKTWAWNFVLKNNSTNCLVQDQPTFNKFFYWKVILISPQVKMLNRNQNNGKGRLSRREQERPILVCGCSHCRYVRGEPLRPQVPRLQPPNTQLSKSQRNCNCSHCRNLLGEWWFKSFNEGWIAKIWFVSHSESYA